jgi:calcium-dependent protein kinase
MGLCCSSPVADTAQHSARGSVNAPQDGQAGRNRQKDGSKEQGKGGRAGETNAKGRRTSVDWNKPILGQFEDVKERYAFEKVLGKGQFGVTRLVVDLATGEQCACKSISKRKLVSQEDMEDVRREIKVMHHLSGHPHVVTFKGGENNSSNGSMS